MQRSHPQLPVLTGRLGFRGCKGYKGGRHLLEQRPVRHELHAERNRGADRHKRQRRLHRPWQPRPRLHRLLPSGGYRRLQLGCRQKTSIQVGAPSAGGFGGTAATLSSPKAIFVRVAGSASLNKKARLARVWLQLPYRVAPSPTWYLWYLDALSSLQHIRAQRLALLLHGLPQRLRAAATGSCAPTRPARRPAAAGSRHMVVCERLYPRGSCFGSERCGRLTVGTAPMKSASGAGCLLEAPPSLCMPGCCSLIQIARAER